MDRAKHILDWLAGGLSVGAAVQLIHVLLAVPASLYMCFRCYEWLEKRRKAKRS